MKKRIPFIVVLILIAGSNLSLAGAFGEIAISAGGIFPQGSFARYADPGGMLTIRGTVHIPNMEMFVAWADFGFAQFARDEFDTYKKTEIPGLPPFYEPITQVTKEDMITGHIGLQLASMTKRALFRPRAALGIGFYLFSHEIEWKEDVGDSMVVIASKSLDSKNCWGWRATVGLDMFFSPQWGGSFEMVYDHVFNLRQNESINETTNRTSRFNGFTIGLIYMFGGKQ
ncbi:MAG: hypothetical protein V3V99_13740 [candidate division Zixibacteria bacterium]